MPPRQSQAQTEELMKKKNVGQLVALMVGVAVAIGGVVVVTGAAQAAANTKTYQVTKNIPSSTLGVCLKVTLYGKLDFKQEWKASKYNGKHTVTDRTLVNPTMAVKAYSGTKCRTSKKLDSIKMEQRWYSYSCDVNPGIQVSGLPFAVGLAPTIKCGNKTVAKRSDSNPANSASYVASNTGRPVRFTGDADWAKRCMAVDAYVTATVKGRTDSVKTNFKVCP
jgi:hypothetical protein